MKHYPLLVLLLLFSYCSYQPSGTTKEHPFGKNVLIFDSEMEMESIQATVDSLAELQDHRDREFGPHRFALLFKPGEYELDVYVGYYTQAAGLGKLPGDVLITGSVASRQVRQTALSNFWRSAENLTVDPLGEPNYWIASQAAPFRRIHVKGELRLSGDGYTSGGFIANSVIDSTVYSGTQQQFFTRNSIIKEWQNGVWNMFFLGVDGAPENNWHELPFTTIEQTPIIREKPFLFMDDDEEFKVFVPALRKDAIGPDWVGGNPTGEVLDLDSFFIVKEENYDINTINEALKDGKNLLVTPGKYYIDLPIHVIHPGTIILGMGYASFIPTKGNKAAIVEDVGGVTLAGITFDAGQERSEVLLQLGDDSSTMDHSENPTFLFDIFCRVGTDQVGTTSLCIEINSNNVIADHFWLWRADHGPSAIAGRPGWAVNLGENGLIVNGDDVIIYGLFAEHFTEYQTIWNGERGRTYFYQSEMPYDPPSQSEWKLGTTDGYASYKVSDHVENHKAWGLGIYNTFQVAPVFADRAIEAPLKPNVEFKHMITFWLSGKGGGIRHVINDTGGPSLQSSREATVASFPE